MINNTSDHLFALKPILSGLNDYTCTGMEFFRFCPGCGHRFHVKLEGKNLVHLERVAGREAPGIQARGGRGGVSYVGRGGPVIIDVEEFLYNYKCKQCGHGWSEKRIEEHKEG
jgi:DNA-directed RNA polymerase subunit RPC12/RpoP